MRRRAGGPRRRDRAAALPDCLSWDPTKQVRSIYCHRRLTAKFQEVFGDIEQRGLSGKVRTFGGCFNFRAKRSGSKLSAPGIEAAAG